MVLEALHFHCIGSCWLNWAYSGNYSDVFQALKMLKKAENLVKKSQFEKLSFFAVSVNRI